MHTKIYQKFTSLFSICCLSGFLYGQSTMSENGANGKTNWVVKNPFEHKVFIENKGQFDNAVSSPEKILYYTKVGNVKVYFTAHSVYYKLQQSQTSTSEREEEHPEEWKNEQPIIHTFSMQWQGANASSYIDAGDEVSNYFTYDGPQGSTIKANGFKKIIYKNIYPFTDIVFTIPEKGGIEYSILLHPGADVDKIKMNYSDKNSLQIEKDGSICHFMVSAGTVNVKEYGPEAHYSSSVSNTISSSFLKQGDMVTFQLGKHDVASEIVIDPWVIVPSFTPVNKAFDMGKDLSGNIYIQGGGANNMSDPWEIEKYSSVGALQWTYTTPWNQWKGGFAVDGTGCSYAGDGCCTGALRKLTPSGFVRLSIATIFTEYWMMSFDCSLTNLYIGIGLHNGSIAIFDTATGALSNNTMVVVGNETRAMGWAPNNNIYFLTETSDDLVAVNPLFAPLFTVPSGYNWLYLPNPDYATGNSSVTGHNAIGAGLSFLVTTDGGTLMKRNLNTGALITQKTIPGGSAEEYSGVTVDYCGNVFVGGKDSVFQYDSTLNEVKAIHVPDSVYCVIQGNNSNILACGAGFLANLDFATKSNSSVDIAFTKAGCNHCNGTATATLKLCGLADTTTVSYLWSNGETSRTATGLCAGTYKVIVSGCFQNAYEDSVTIAGGLLTSASSTSPGCNINNGTATATPFSGIPPYTWKWSNGATTQTITGLSVGTYTCIVKDSAGCADTTIITLTNPNIPTITVIPPKDSVCKGKGVTLLAGGGSTYSWQPSSGLSCNTCVSPIATPSVTTIYTVIGTDSVGCKGVDSIKVKVFPLPVLVTKPIKDSICNGKSDTLSISGASAYLWKPSASLSCNNCPNPIATPTTTTIYTVVGISPNGCVDSTSVSLIITPPPVVTVTPPQKICEGDSVTLAASGGGTYRWSTGSTNGTIVVNPVTNTVYTVTVTKVCTAVTTTSVTVVPSLLFACCDTIIANGDNVVLSANSSNTYKWMPATGLSCDTCSSVIATPTVTTTYTVIGVNSAGCQTERTITVVVEYLCKDFVIPNVFTPSDAGPLGLNNVFYIKTTDLDSWSLIIYDRWGKEMYHSTTLNEYWDGNTEGGSKAPDGVYYYIINAICESTTYKKDGFVQLIR